MKITFYGGQKAGIIALLTLKALGFDVKVIAEDDDVFNMAEALGLPVRKIENINKMEIEADLIVLCHARQIIGKELISKFKIINLHPCLYAYKGGDPVGRMLKDGVTKASVGCHHVIEEVDAGEVIVEDFKEVTGKTYAEVYSELYPLYSQVLIKALSLINKNDV